MDCKNVEAFLSFYVFGELDSADRVPVEAHLQVCGKCTRSLEKYRVTQEALKMLPEVRVPPDFLVAVRAGISQPPGWLEGMEGVFEAFQLRRAMTGASLAMVLGLAFFVGQSSQMLFPGEHGVLQESASASTFSGKRLLAKHSVDKDPVASPQSLSFQAAATSNEKPRKGGKALVAAPRKQLKSKAPRVPSVARKPAASPSLPSVEEESGASALFAPRSSRPVLQASLSERSREARRPFASERLPSVAEAFDADFGAPARERLQISEQPSRARKSLGVPRKAENEKKVFKDSPFEAGVMFASRMQPGARDLEKMDAEALAGELDRLAPAPPQAARQDEGMEIFSPGGEGEQVLARLASEEMASDSFADADADLSGEVDAPELAPLVPVSLAWVRTTFGRRVEVQGMAEYHTGPAVARELGVQTRSPKRFLVGLRDLVEAGLGLELQRIVFRTDEEVEVVLAFGSGLRGLDSMERFVENVRSLPEVHLASDFSRRVGEGERLLARFVVPNR
jgi:hypothetical protein